MTCIEEGTYPLRKLGIIMQNIFSESYYETAGYWNCLSLKNHQVSSWYMLTASGLEATHAIPIIPGNCGPSSLCWIFGLLLLSLAAGVFL